MSPYEILSLTTDLKIKATGETKELVFSEMLRGVFESADPEFDFVKKEAEKVTREVEIKSANLTNMLVEFLNEAIYFSDEENVAYMVAEFKKLTDTELKAVIFGQKVRKFHKKIKVASYRGAKIEEKDGEWEAIIKFEV